MVYILCEFQWFMFQWIINMRKYRVLQLGLQLGFLATTSTCNSWYLYGFEC
jgi:hypothetical protein